MDIKLLYDEEADVLYVNILPKRPATSEEIASNVLLRKDPHSGECIGVTIIGFLGDFVTKQRWDVINFSEAPQFLVQFFQKLRINPRQVIDCKLQV